MTFLSPILLFALLLLPIIFLFLKAIPPLPREQPFPPINLLRKLQSNLKETSKTPWWLLLLRVLAVSLFILGLAQPVFTTKHTTSDKSSDPILLIIDNGWASGAQWQFLSSQALQIVKQASQNQQEIDLLLTAPDEQNTQPHLQSHIQASSLYVHFDSIRSFPWPVDRQKSSTILEQINQEKHRYKQIYYLSDGVKSDYDKNFAAALQSIGPVNEIRMINPSDAGSVVVLRPPTIHADNINISYEILPTAKTRHLILQARNLKGNILTSVAVTVPANANRGDIKFSLPIQIRNKIDYFQFAQIRGAGNVFFLDKMNRQHLVGLIQSTDNANTPFIGSLFYIRNALLTHNLVRDGSVENLLSSDLSVLIATDGSLINPIIQHKVADWVKNGGMLIRFAGPLLAASNMQENQQQIASDLLPLPLLTGSRELGGTMTWEKPQSLSPFPSDSPLNGLTVPKDVQINRQLLAKPVADLNHYCWARLEDGTPLITHRTLGLGQIVFFHISSTPDWSSLPLSGLFVSILDRLVDASEGIKAMPINTNLPPLNVLNGEGSLETPISSTQGVHSQHLSETLITPNHPPGLYGSYYAYQALNLGNKLPTLLTQDPIGKIQNLSGNIARFSLGAILIVISLLLILLDTILSLFLQGRLKKSFGIRLVVIFIIFNSIASVHAQEIPPTHSPAAALQTRLAYIKTGHETIDIVSKQGLEGLSQYVNARTTVRLSSPEGIDPTKDNLAFYPIIYWPITADIEFDAKRSEILNNYMAHGGILLLDTQGHDQNTNTQPLHPEHFSGEAQGTAKALKRATQALNIPALTILNDQNLLSHTFYIIHEFPGRYNAMPVWISQGGDLTNDGISSIIIGENDWAHAWAVRNNEEPLYAVIPGGEDQRRIAFRFGTNLVIYALTGSYKADQIHVSTILKRIGQN